MPTKIEVPQKAAQASSDPWLTDKSTWENISIPSETGLGDPHDDFSINYRKFEAGKTYLVPHEVAVFLQERLRVYAKEQVRRLQPKRDLEAQKHVNYGSVNGGSITPIDASQLG